MNDAATRVSLSATGQSLSIEGTVCITASELIAAHILPPIIGRLRRAHPGIDLRSSPRTARATCGVARPTSRSATSRRRSRSWSRRRSPTGARGSTPPRPISGSSATRPRRRTCLARILRLRSQRDHDQGLRALGIDLTPKNFPIITDNHLVQWELAKLGLGICIVMDEVGDAEPRVRRVLPDLAPLPVPVWLATHRELRTSRRIRVVFDLLAEELSK